MWLYGNSCPPGDCVVHFGGHQGGRRISHQGWRGWGLGRLLGGIQGSQRCRSEGRLRLWAWRYGRGVSPGAVGVHRRVVWGWRWTRRCWGWRQICPRWYGRRIPRWMKGNLASSKSHGRWQRWTWGLGQRLWCTRGRGGCCRGILWGLLMGWICVSGHRGLSLRFLRDCPHSGVERPGLMDYLQSLSSARAIWGIASQEF